MIHADPFWIFFYLVAGHALCDYPLQGSFLSEAKCKGPLPNWHLFAHSIIHGAAVGLVTGWLSLALAETVVHFGIDKLKARGYTTLGFDQILHIACKVTWVMLVMFWGNDFAMIVGAGTACAFFAIIFALGLWEDNWRKRGK